MNALEKFNMPSYRYFPKSGGLAYSGPQTWIRILIVQALERLRIPLDDWPPFGRDFAKHGFLLPGDGSSFIEAEPFSLRHSICCETLFLSGKLVPKLFGKSIVAHFSRIVRSVARKSWKPVESLS